MLRDLRTRGLKPWNVTVADGHLGIWSALAEIFPSHRYNKRGTAEQWIKQAVKLTRRLFGSYFLDRGAAIARGIGDPQDRADFGAVEGRRSVCGID